MYFLQKGALPGSFVKASFEYPKDWNEGHGWISTNDAKTWQEAEVFAGQCSVFLGTSPDEFIPIDNGDHVRPRYDVAQIPKVGDAVSKSFNGDSYPEGYITSISGTLRKITTSTGETFYRYRQTGGWRSNKTWWLTPGHHDERNPHI